MLGAPAAAQAALTGPVYPVPGGPGTGHGGSTCLALSDAEAAMGKTAATNTASDGQTWHYGGGSTPAQVGTGCPFAGATDPLTLPAFDTARWDRLLWGPTFVPQLALDGLYNLPGETLTFNVGSSNLPGGVLIWDGATTMNWCETPNCGTFQTETPIATRFTLRARTLGGVPVALVSAAALGMNPQLGGFVDVTGGLPRFKAQMVFEAVRPPGSTGAGTFQPAITMFNSFNHPNPPPNPTNTLMSFGAAFHYENRAPVSAFACVPGSPTDAQDITCTSSSSDPDAAAGDTLTQRWDWNGNGTTTDDVDSARTGPQASGRFPAGTHTIGLHVTDAEGKTTVTTSQVVVTSSAEGTGTGTGAGSSTVPIPGSTPTPAGVPAPGSGSAGPTSRTAAPVAVLTLSRQKLKAALTRGLRGTLALDKAATSVLSITLSAKDARRLRLRNPIGKATVRRSAPGRLAFAIRFTRAAKLRLARLPRITLVVTATSSGAAGSTSTVRKRLSVKK